MGISRRWKILVNGTVQGVGFRPFVYLSAHKLNLTGFVTNTPDGVLIEAQGNEQDLNALVEKIRTEHPPLARVQEISFDEVELKNDTVFEILKSQHTGNVSTQISPDIAPCDDCLMEMQNSKDRRFSYPFINCTNCGPRYTIIESLPYDRPKTTMRHFEMCPSCHVEYKNPLDRRFHAQPVACDKCGPRVELVTRDTRHETRDLGLEKSQNPIKDAVKFLDEGKIIAIKGVGGFHLACDATNDEAVKELRRRKHRDEKPFAVMVGNVETARELCEISELEEKLLTSPQRPIVLLRCHESRVTSHESQLSDLIAPNNKNLGLMLPSSPLHFLLFGLNESRVPSPESRLLVMTSANISDEPLAYKNDEAMKKLKDIADFFLIHDRDIHIRVDDSIVRTMNNAPLVLRRARGYTPEPIRLAFELPEILATGADLKNSVCLTKGRNVYLSQHLGDLENLETHKSFEQTIEHLQNVFDIKPKIIACDMHPNYFSTQYAGAVSRVTSHESRVTVQHHHAHIASCMAENDLPNEKVIGIALDGAGLGTDGAIWGGEVLIADYSSFERAAHFAYVPMPGGDIAAKEPWRMAIAYSLPFIKFPLPLPQRQHPRGLWERVRERGHKGHPPSNSLPSREGGRENIEKIDIVHQMLEKNLNCPKTSSCGRLFDAVAALTGLCTLNSFEGQAAMMLEQAADENETGKYSYTIGTRDTGLKTRDQKQGTIFIIDYSQMFEEIIKDTALSTPISSISAKFHNTLVSALTDVSIRVSKSRVSCPVSRVCLSGGSFQNALLSTRLKNNLEKAGFQVYTHRLVPPNDGGIALGQAVIAALGTVPNLKFNNGEL